MAAVGAAGCSGSGDDNAASSTSVRASTTTSTLPVPDLPGDPFKLGIASGDPLADRVILWTRLAPDPLNGGGMPAGDVPVRWEVAADGDEKFAKPLAEGTAVATAAHGHSVHVDAEGLEPVTWYRYRFRVGDKWTSPTGRTRTAPAAGKGVDRLVFGFASCQNWQDGYYNAWRDVVLDEELELLVFLGDYIYEGGPAPLDPKETVRQHNSPEVTDLAGYRNRYALHRSDPLLRAAHGRVPWMAIWDDHEVENNYANDRSEDTMVDPAAFLLRRAAAYQAWWENMPVRLDPPTGPNLRINRKMAWGSLADFILMDERQYRTDQACGDVTLDLGPACDEINSEGRTMLGAEQEQWVYGQLDASTATWRVLGNEVVMTPITVGNAILNYDQWDGYPAERDRLLAHIDEQAMTNVVVITGDIHLAGVGDLTRTVEGASRTVATELVGTSISSGGLLPAGTEGLVTSAVPAIKYVNSSQRGWTRCTVTPEKWTAEYRMVVDNLQEESPTAVDATFEILPTAPGARRL